MPTFTPNPFYIQPFGCSGSINCNWQTAGTLAPLAAGPIVGAVARGATITRLGLVSESSNPLRFSQTTASFSFSNEGKFAGRTIEGVAADLRSGTMTPTDVPVQFITRNGTNLIVDTRSALALRRAGISQGRWNLVNVSGDATMQSRITNRLIQNGLTDSGTPTLRITGFGRNTSRIF